MDPSLIIVIFIFIIFIFFQVLKRLRTNKRKENLSAKKRPNKFYKSVKQILLLTFLLIGLIIFTSAPIGKFFRKGNEAVIVFRVIDGDTFRSSSGNTYRLIGINTPERGRYGYETATTYLSYLLTQCPDNILPGFRTVRITTTGKGTYGRDLAYVYCNGESINEQMVEEGYAISYRKYPHKYTDRYNSIEQKAKNNQRGLWPYWFVNGYNAY